MHTLKVYQRFRRLTQISDGNLWNCSIALLLSCSVFMWATSSLKALPFTALHCVLFLSGFHQDRNTEFFFAERRRRWMSKLFGGTMIIMFQVGKGTIQKWIISKRHYQQKKSFSLSIMSTMQGTTPYPYLTTSFLSPSRNELRKTAS